MPESTAGRPTSPGWYWMRGFGDSSWIIVRVVEVRGKLCTRDPFGDRKHPVGVDDPFWGVVEWAGPIKATDIVELARLRETGDALVGAAKKAAMLIDDTTYREDYNRLCEAIWGWLKSRMEWVDPEASPCE